MTPARTESVTQMDADERQYTLQELATTAGVSVRTIRYYIGEGLLPAPAGAGPQSHYTGSHLDRLRVIALLKDRFLPLKEIRKQLSRLDDAAIEQLLDELDAGASADVELTDVAGDAPAAAPAAMSIREDAAPMYDALSYLDTALERGRARFNTRRGQMHERRAESSAEGEQWRKIEVADGVELLVRDDVFRRRRDRIDWLIDWARKVVD